MQSIEHKNRYFTLRARKKRLTTCHVPCSSRLGITSREGISNMSSPPLIHSRRRTTSRRGRVRIQSTRTSRRGWATRRRHTLGHREASGRRERKVGETTWAWLRDSALHVRGWRGEATCGRSSVVERRRREYWETVGSWGWKFLSVS